MCISLVGLSAGLLVGVAWSAVHGASCVVVRQLRRRQKRSCYVPVARPTLIEQMLELWLNQTWRMLDIRTLVLKSPLLSLESDWKWRQGVSTICWSCTCVFPQVCSWCTHCISVPRQEFPLATCDPLLADALMPPAAWSLLNPFVDSSLRV